MAGEKHQDTAEIFSRLVLAYFQGCYRFNDAQLAFELLSAALITYRTSQEVDISEHPYSEVLDYVKRTSTRAYRAFEYVGRISHLVYATTLFDTFISDCTHFLLLLHPRAMGKNHEVHPQCHFGLPYPRNLKKY